jgi:type I restriction enzyme, R subunit
VRVALVKPLLTQKKQTAEKIDQAIRQIISRAVASDEVIDVFAAAGLRKPDISILSDEFLGQVKGMPQRNLAVELLRKLLTSELKIRSRKFLIQSRPFSELLEGTLRKYRNRSIEAAQVVEELIALAKELRAVEARGENLKLTEDELAFYDALETNDSAVKALGDENLRFIAQALVKTTRENVSIDWTVKQSVRARLPLAIESTKLCCGTQNCASMLNSLLIPPGIFPSGE